MIEKIKDFFRQHKFVGATIAAIIIVFLYLLFFRRKNSTSDTSDVVSQSQVKNSGQVLYSPASTNTDTGYTSDNIADTVGAQVSKISDTFTENQNKLYEILQNQQEQISNLRTPSGDYTAETSTYSASPEETHFNKILDYAAQMAKYKEGYTGAHSDTDRANYSSMGNSLRQTALAYAQKNNMKVEPVDTKQGYYEYKINGVQI